jgi:adenylyltransferase/sulfurtransferase
MIAMQQVNEVLKLITGIGKPLTNELLIYNSLENTQLKMKLKPTVLKEKIAKLFKIQTYLAAFGDAQEEALQISSAALKDLLENSDATSNGVEKQIEIIAVLPNLALPFKVQQTIPIQEFDVANINVDFNKTYVMVCQRGFNSYKATKMLKNKYPELTVLNLKGGISEY